MVFLHNVAVLDEGKQNEVQTRLVFCRLFQIVAQMSVSSSSSSFPGQSVYKAQGINCLGLQLTWQLCINNSSLSWDSLFIRAPDSWLKVVSSNLDGSGGRIFFSRVYFVCWLLFGVHSTPMSLQWHEKDPGHSAKSAGGWLHLNMHTPLTQWSGSGLTMLLCRHSVGTYQETSSHATHQGTLGHSRLSLLSYSRLILA